MTKIDQPPTDADILVAATRFREALEGIDRSLWAKVYIENFPRGACGHTAELLGRFLQSELGIDAEYVCRDFYYADGSRNSSHAWLEYNGLTIDIDVTP